MILQTHGGQLLLIRQTDHAALAGVFAEHWGNADFARPSPRDPLIAAAIHHDDGWLLWEAAPRLDPAVRRPYQFTAMPAAEHVSFYRAGIERVLAFAPYAGLLTVMHLAGLYQMRFDTDRSIQPKNLSAEEERLQRQFLDELQQQQEALRRELPQQGVPASWLEEHRLWCNYKLLQMYDRLSLYFCTAPPRSAVLEPAPLDYEGGETQLTLTPLTERTVAITPYPFDRSPLPFTVRACIVPDRDYASDNDFRAVFAAAPLTELSFEVRA
ncbi:MAG TPA: DUF3891 family protein [Gemmataceae bacterium]|nr:DUF3891 family protein [Gemmataceae bacterium]